ncbi:MAG: molybdenum cofactor synthesis protein [bacterium]|jgi:molybdenum cofactor synthesis domain-containing protein
MTSREFEILSVNLSTEKGTSKHPAGEIEIGAAGVVGDAHAGAGARQVSLLAIESIERFGREEGREFSPGEFAENLTTRGFLFGDVRVLDEISIGDVLLEVTQIGKPCHGGGGAIFRDVGKCVMPNDGVFARVVRTGRVSAGDRGVHLPRRLRISVITVSDRASRGEYVDKSGPAVCELLKKHFEVAGWRCDIAAGVVPDDAKDIRAALNEAISIGADVVFAVGGTGIGPRDVTPEVVAEFIDKPMTGVVDAMRAKFGAGNPNALLSRAVAGASGTRLFYAIPGSPRAATEYASEILCTLEHAIFMVRGVDTHAEC